MNGFLNSTVNFYLNSIGRSYPNMGRLFLRLFVGVMMMQFGIRHLVNFNELCIDFPTVLNMSPMCSLIIMIIIELGCSLLIMVGFLTRMSVIPPVV
ncbi:MAG: DoxX family protein, partial [Duncaniella sp.]|nr:DoxX family protein [Duncaniella sp.]